GPWYGGDIVTRRGEVLEVRHTEVEHGGLPIHPYDDLARYFFLAIGIFPAYRLAGLLPGRLAQRRSVPPPPTRDGPSRLVPQSRLWAVIGWIRGRAPTDDEVVRQRLLDNWPRSDHADLVRLAERSPAEARLVYDLILHLDARPRRGT